MICKSFSTYIQLNTKARYLMFKLIHFLVQIFTHFDACNTLQKKLGQWHV